MASDEASESAVYVLAPSRQLPLIDPNKSVKQALLTAHGVARFNHVVRRLRRLLGVSYWVGTPLGMVTFFVPTHVGLYLAAFSMPMQLVPSVITVFVMRYDIVRLVATTYEFWYMTLSNLAVSSLISYSFYDARALIMIGSFVAFETALLVDANHRASRLISFATVFGACTNFTYIVCAMFKVIDYGYDLLLLRYRHHVLYADDAITNLNATLLVLLIRNGFRRFRHSTNSRITRCITYRCRVAFVLQDSTSTPSRSSVPPVVAQPPSTTLTPLEFVRDHRVFHSSDVLIQMPTLHQPHRARRLILIVAPISFTAWTLTFFLSDSKLLRFVATLPLVGAVVSLLCLFSMAQRELLRTLVTSFDFVFLSVQFSITHACLADIIGWRDAHTPAIVASWLWIHWVLTLDAVMPTHKSGAHKVAAIAVVLLFVAGHLAVAVAVITSESTSHEIRDRVVYSVTLNRHVKHVRVVPLLFGRLVTTLSWSLRLLWRLWDATPGELLMLQGSVEYSSSLTASGPLASFPLASRNLQILPHARKTKTTMTTRTSHLTSAGSSRGPSSMATQVQQQQ